MRAGQSNPCKWRREKDVQFDRVFLMEVETSARRTLSFQIKKIVIGTDTDLWGFMVRMEEARDLRSLSGGRTTLERFWSLAPQLD
jgi:hypothetical protein